MTAYDTYNDNELWKLVQADDHAAFTAIYEHYWEKLFFTAHRRLQLTEEAQEIVQDVFFTLWQKRTDLHIQELPLYLGAMVRYAVYRKLAKRGKVQSLEAIPVGYTPPAVAAFDMDNRQFLEILGKLANDLPEKHRIVFVQHKLLDQPLEEVAARLGVSVRTAEDYVTRAMKIMRKNRDQLLSFLLL